MRSAHWSGVGLTRAAMLDRLPLESKMTFIHLSHWRICCIFQGSAGVISPVLWNVYCWYCMSQKCTGEWGSLLFDGTRVLCQISDLGNIASLHQQTAWWLKLMYRMNWKLPNLLLSPFQNFDLLNMSHWFIHADNTCICAHSEAKLRHLWFSHWTIQEIDCALNVLMVKDLH